MQIYAQSHDPTREKTPNDVTRPAGPSDLWTCNSDMPVPQIYNMHGKAAKVIF